MTSRAYIIGDDKNGMTIVVTDPVLVIHYTAEDLYKALTNPNYDPVRDGPVPLSENRLNQAALTREIHTLLRGVNLNALEGTEQAINAAPHGSTSLNEEKALFAELDYGRTIGKIIRRGGSVYDVDFCLAVDLNVDVVSRGARSREPGSSIISYLNSKQAPSSWPISGVPKSESDFADPPVWP